MSSPGWYPDPSGVEGQSRSWDGQGWTSSVPGAGCTRINAIAPSFGSASGLGL
ncbi:MAG: DUF2510 domain-containing protein [Acidimicrobiales bacterium]